MPGSIAISQLAICPEKTIIRRPAATLAAENVAGT